MNVYEIVVNFLDPARGVLQVRANTEEEAVNAVRNRLEDSVINLEIESIQVVTDPTLVDSSISNTVN